MLFLYAARRKPTVAVRMGKDLEPPEMADRGTHCATCLANCQNRLGRCCLPTLVDDLYHSSLSSAEPTQTPTSTPAVATNTVIMAPDNKPQGSADGWCGILMMLHPIYSNYCRRFLNWVEGRVCKILNLTPTPPDSPSSPTLPLPSPHTEEDLLQENENLKQLLAEAERKRKEQEMNNQRDMLQLQLQVARLEVEVELLGRDLCTSFFRLADAIAFY